MSLEAATYVQDLDATNPTAGDLKSQGDDHLRLIKAALKNTFLTASRGFSFPRTLTKSADYVVLTADDASNIFVGTTTGPINITLPTPSFDGWMVTVVKGSTDVNPVFVIPPSGTINQGLAKVRVNVPWVGQTFIYAGGSFFRVQDFMPGEVILFPGATPVGFAAAVGQSLLRVDYPELYAAWQTTYGAVDGTHFNAPDYRDRFIIGFGSAALGATGGAATVTLDTTMIPAHTHANSLTDPGHHHGGIPSSAGVIASIGTTPSADPAYMHPTGANTSDASTGISITNASAGGGLAHENRPPYLVQNPIFRLC